MAPAGNLEGRQAGWHVVIQTDDPLTGNGGKRRLEGGPKDLPTHKRLTTDLLRYQGPRMLDGVHIGAIGQKFDGKFAAQNPVAHLQPGSLDSAAAYKTKILQNAADSVVRWSKWHLNALRHEI